MAKEVASLVKRAQEDSSLRDALMSDPIRAAQDLHISEMVARSAAYALRAVAVGLAVFGVWF